MLKIRWSWKKESRHKCLFPLSTHQLSCHVDCLSRISVVEFSLKASGYFNMISRLSFLLKSNFFKVKNNHLTVFWWIWKVHLKIVILKKFNLRSMKKCFLKDDSLYNPYKFSFEIKYIRNAKVQQWFHKKAAKKINYFSR
jgi:hypothetical protein